MTDEGDFADRASGVRRFPPGFFPSEDVCQCLFKYIKITTTSPPFSLALWNVLLEQESFFMNSRIIGGVYSIDIRLFPLSHRLWRDIVLHYYRILLKFYAENSDIIFHDWLIPWSLQCNAILRFPAESALVIVFNSTETVVQVFPHVLTWPVTGYRLKYCFTILRCTL